jgi:hypothetical protein
MTHRPPPPPTPAWKITLAFAGIFVFVVTVLWQAARYPNRAEFEGAQETTTQHLDTLRENINAIQIEQTMVRGDVNAIRNSQHRIERSQEMMADRLTKALRGRR